MSQDLAQSNSGRTPVAPLGRPGNVSNNNNAPVFLTNAASVDIQGGEFNNAAGHIIHINNNTRIPDESQPPSWSATQGSASSFPLQWIWSLFSTMSGGRVSPDCQIYAQSLMPNGVGFPLWFPEPGRRLPAEYRMKGVSIGDVGLITPDGAFDYLFNICRPSDDPINLNRVPENFSPVEAWDPSDVHEVEFVYPPGGHVASRSIERGVSVNIGQEYHFQCLTSEGAILTTPDGASRENLRNLLSFQRYACKNAVSWYNYANGTRGRQARNGSIYLVTGCDKGKSWGVAAFSNVTERNGFSLTFTAPTVGTTTDPLCTWQASSLAKTRAGPIPVDYLNGTSDRAQNQCLFLRGFRVALGQGISADLLATAGISRVEDISARDIFPNSVPGADVTPFRGSSSLSYFQLSSGGGGTSYSGRHQASLGGDQDVILFADFPDESDTYHPSYAINRYLLEQVPNALVVITHDDDWASVIRKDETVLPDASELISRIQEQYDFKFESGAVSLVVKDAAKLALPPAADFKQSTEAQKNSPPDPPPVPAPPVSNPEVMQPDRSKTRKSSKPSIWPRRSYLFRPFKKPSSSSSNITVIPPPSERTRLSLDPAQLRPSRRQSESSQVSSTSSKASEKRKREQTHLSSHLRKKTSSTSRSFSDRVNMSKDDNKENLEMIPSNVSDPFAVFLAPPVGENPAERAERKRREADAKRVSDEIDECIRHERDALKNQKSVVRVLLLGQSESGKSTTLKNFLMRYANKAWNQQRSSWRSVIQLNLVRSIITILDLLQAEKEGDLIFEEHEDDSDSLVPRITVTQKHDVLRLRLLPLRRVEVDLRRRLGVDTGMGPAATQTTPFQPHSRSDSLQNMTLGDKNEVVVRGWREVLEKRWVQMGTNRREGDRDFDEITQIIAACQDDMKALWMDEAVQALINLHWHRLEHLTTFFLDDLDRIAVPSYQPSDDDVVRARLRTTGVQEHRIQIEYSGGNETRDREWIFYDVGGSRSCRQAWLPFFDKANAIIFLAPISCFDEKLAEDRHINRLEDSTNIWKSICSSKLLTSTAMIVFMNKCDILKRKLKSGVQVRRHVPSFGDRPNDATTFTQYMRAHFKYISRQYSPVPRSPFIFATAVIDTQATSATLTAVQTSIIREHLRDQILI